ncbi:hypothetical protein Poli38472_003238 [Pythium oligandrum]|uniref:Peptidase S54 rhomboid domain-containing protein n=1 Tax=Pythium oligandrum TaxID=41045 RepID=A0A8K1FG00_PYTOL|nr:hypothetical protein Poli38472_003238 [Pythium oligandrum]|eukprot:TMW57313.1 hypothetical protein Poli38472_003238 [Pythium oligandrum]
MMLTALRPSLAARGLHAAHSAGVSRMAVNPLRHLHIRPSSMVMSSRVTHITRRHAIARHTITSNKLQTQRRSFGGGYGNGVFDSAERIVYVLIGANIVVTMLWQTADTPRKRARMVTYFTTSSRHLENGHYHTLLTSVFSHADMGHLFTNMFGLFFFGREISYVLGPKRFLGLYLVSGVLSSWAAVEEQKRSYRMSLNLGASGAVNSITALSILLYPQSTLLIFGIVPIPAWIAGSLFIGRDLYGWLGGSHDGIGHFAHLSGAACGGLYYAYLRRNIRRFR